MVLKMVRKNGGNIAIGLATYAVLGDAVKKSDSKLMNLRTRKEGRDLEA